MRASQVVLGIKGKAEYPHHSYKDHCPNSRKHQYCHRRGDFSISYALLCTHGRAVSTPQNLQNAIWYDTDTATEYNSRVKTARKRAILGE